MTNEQDVARNAAAVRNLAARLERNGYVGDAHTEAEHIALNLLADGYARIEPVPAPRGPGASRAAIDEAQKATEAAVRAAKDSRKTGGGCGWCGGDHYAFQCPGKKTGGDGA